jgi:hypothetical protein
MSGSGWSLGGLRPQWDNARVVFATTMRANTKQRSVV